ncbi:MAG: MBL fold metallo-hydrolase [Acidobacteria bacterium]|nr:MAG: MBL fold metallo-hydrolase [Acidobacteriota bacterium]
MSAALVPEQVGRLSPLVRRVTQNNPGIMTGPGTNTYLIGRDALFILDPGEDTDEHFRAVLEAVGATPVAGIAPTHAHPDHWPLAPRLAAAVRAETYGLKPHNGYQPARLMSEGATVRGPGWTLEALHTPGHTSDHLSYFLREERALFSGDHVMAWSTSVIAYPDGSLTSYIASLERLLALDIARMYPAHGETIEDGRARVRELIEHRRMRTGQVRLALAAGIETVPALVERIYADVDPRLHAAARLSLLAHLEALVQSGEAVVSRPAGDPLQARYALRDAAS